MFLLYSRKPYSMDILRALLIINIPLNDGARIRIRLPVEGSQDHGQYDAGQKEETAPTDAGPESVLSVPKEEKNIKTNQYY